MKPVTTKIENGYWVTRFFGVRIWKRPEAELSEQTMLLRRELLSMADVGRMPPARGMARDVQLVGRILLREVMRVARENGFHPWVICGALLGIVRHGGNFVPWDDDVDLGLMREEYDRFCEVFNEKCQDGFYAWRRYSRKWNQIKFSHHDVPKDVTLSIFPYDRYYKPLPTLAEKHALFMKVRAEQERISRLVAETTPEADRKAAFADARERVVLEGRGSAPDAARPAIFAGVEFVTPRWVKETVYDYEDVFPLQKAVFEGVEVSVPNDPETVLTYNYGDWAGWPGRLRPHHPASAFKMEKALALHKFLKRHPEPEQEPADDRR